MTFRMGDAVAVITFAIFAIATCVFTMTPDKVLIGGMFAILVCIAAMDMNGKRSDLR